MGRKPTAVVGRPGHCPQRRLHCNPHRRNNFCRRDPLWPETLPIECGTGSDHRVDQIFGCLLLEGLDVAAVFKPCVIATQMRSAPSSDCVPQGVPETQFKPDRQFLAVIEVTAERASSWRQRSISHRVRCRALIDTGPVPVSPDSHMPSHPSSRSSRRARIPACRRIHLRGRPREEDGRLASLTGKSACGSTSALLSQGARPPC